MLSRRSFLIFGAAGAATLATPALAAPKVRPERSLNIYNIHTGESFKTVYWIDGNYVPKSIAQLNRLMRDHRNDDVFQMDRRLYDVLYSLQRKIGAKKPLHVVCGYRSPETNEMLRATSGGVASNSLHMRGMAVDVKVPGLSNRVMAKAAKGLKAGGVGTYSQFVHVDTGPVRFW